MQKERKVSILHSQNLRVDKNPLFARYSAFYQLWFIYCAFRTIRKPEDLPLVPPPGIKAPPALGVTVS